MNWGRLKGRHHTSHTFDPWEQKFIQPDVTKNTYIGILYILTKYSLIEIGRAVKCIWHFPHLDPTEIELGRLFESIRYYPAFWGRLKDPI